MPRVVITIPEGRGTEWTRAEEIAVAEKLFSELSVPGTYMEHFFTAGLLQELRQRINNDFSCDVWGDYQNAKITLATVEEKLRKQDEENDKTLAGMKAHADEREMVITRHYTEIKKLQEQIKSIESDMENDAVSIDNLHTTVRKLQYRIDGVKQWLCDSWFGRTGASLEALRDRMFELEEEAEDLAAGEEQPDSRL